MVSALRTPVLMLCLAGVAACSKREAHKVADTKPASVGAPVAKAPEISPDGRLEPNDPKHGTRKLMGLDTPVYVDGEQIAVLRAGELPPIPAIEGEGGSRRYRLYDYVKAIGVAPETIRSIHVHGNSDRIGGVEGTELRKEKDRFVFSFLSGDSGGARQKWDTDGLKNPFSVHEIRRVTIYVKKPAPRVHEQLICHLDEHGACTDAIPYAKGEIAKGTRIYVDGKMVGFVKRRNVTDAMLLDAPAADPSDSKYELAKLISGFRVDMTGVKTMELVSGDSVIGRASASDLETVASHVAFKLPKHGHGKIRVSVPAALQSKEEPPADRDALISAVLLYKNIPANDRELVAISEETDLSVQLANMDDARSLLGLGERK